MKLHVLIPTIFGNHFVDEQAQADALDELVRQLEGVNFDTQPTPGTALVTLPDSFKERIELNKFGRGMISFVLDGLQKSGYNIPPKGMIIAVLHTKDALVKEYMDAADNEGADKIRAIDATHLLVAIGMVE